MLPLKPKTTNNLKTSLNIEVVKTYKVTRDYRSLSIDTRFTVVFPPPLLFMAGETHS